MQANESHCATATLTAATLIGAALSLSLSRLAGYQVQRDNLENLLVQVPEALRPEQLAVDHFQTA